MSTQLNNGGSQVVSMSDVRLKRYQLLTEVMADAQDRISRAFAKTTDAFLRYGGDTEVDAMLRVHANTAAYILVGQIIANAIGRGTGKY